jgi:predicted enzyme related to lactoylglutathione lyase
MAHTVVHFEIPANDPDKLSAFYRELFGWQIEKTPGETEYWLVRTVGEGEPGVNGGMMRRRMPEQQPLNYISVESSTSMHKGTAT